MSENLSLPATYQASHWYSGPRLWKKLTKIALVAGEKGLLTSLTLFYCLKDKDTPAWAKGVIIGALGYLILPVDAIPDIIPGIGLTDDFGTIAAALAIVVAYVKDEHKNNASVQVSRLFGSPKPPAPEEFSE